MASCPKASLRAVRSLPCYSHSMVSRKDPEGHWQRDQRQPPLQWALRMPALFGPPRTEALSWSYFAQLLTSLSFDLLFPEHRFTAQ